MSSQLFCRYLLNKGADPNIKAHDGLDPLMAAVESGDEATVNLLIENGANLKTKTKLTTPVFIAREKGHLELEKLLIDKGAPSDPGAFWKIRRAMIMRWSNLSCT